MKVKFSLKNPMTESQLNQSSNIKIKLVKNQTKRNKLLISNFPINAAPTATIKQQQVDSNLMLFSFRTYLD